MNNLSDSKTLIIEAESQCNDCSISCHPRIKQVNSLKIKNMDDIIFSCYQKLSNHQLDQINKDVEMQI